MSDKLFAANSINESTVWNVETLIYEEVPFTNRLPVTPKSPDKVPPVLGNALLAVVNAELA